MSVAQVAHELVSLCREGKFADAVEALYAPAVVSVEPVGDEQMPAEMRGIEAVRKKGEWWVANHEVHSMEISGPFVGDGGFAVHFRFDVTHKPSGRRLTMSEMGLYAVDGDRVVREEFFYHAG